MYTFSGLEVATLRGVTAIVFIFLVSLCVSLVSLEFFKEKIPKVPQLSFFEKPQLKPVFRKKKLRMLKRSPSTTTMEEDINKKPREDNQSNQPLDVFPPEILTSIYEFILFRPDDGDKTSERIVEIITSLLSVSKHFAKHTLTELSKLKNPLSISLFLSKKDGDLNMKRLRWNVRTFKIFPSFLLELSNTMKYAFTKDKYDLKTTLKKIDRVPFSVIKLVDVGVLDVFEYIPNVLRGKNPQILKRLEIRSAILSPYDVVNSMTSFRVASFLDRFDCSKLERLKLELKYWSPKSLDPLPTVKHFEFDYEPSGALAKESIFYNLGNIATIFPNLVSLSLKMTVLISNYPDGKLDLTFLENLPQLEKFNLETCQRLIFVNMSQQTSCLFDKLKIKIGEKSKLKYLRIAYPALIDIEGKHHFDKMILNPYCWFNEQSLKATVSSVRLDWVNLPKIDPKDTKPNPLLSTVQHWDSIVPKFRFYTDMSTNFPSLPNLFGK